MCKFQDFITLACILVFIIITSRELGEQIFYRLFSFLFSPKIITFYTNCAIV